MVDLTGKNRYRFISLNDKYNFIYEFGSLEAQHIVILTEVIKEIRELRGNSVLIFLIKDFTQISHEDITYIKNSINVIKEKEPNSQTIDIILHSTGGLLSSSKELTHILRNNFKKIHFLVPNQALSAASLLCLSGDSIILGKNACLSPFDLLIYDTPVAIYKKNSRTFKNKNKAEISIKNQSYYRNGTIDSLLAFNFSISRYTPTSFDIFTIKKKFKRLYHGRSKYFKALKITSLFTNPSHYLSHDKRYYFDDLEKMGLKVEKANKELEALLLEVDVIQHDLFYTTRKTKLYQNEYNSVYTFQPIKNEEVTKE